MACSRSDVFAKIWSHCVLEAPVFTLLQVPPGEEPDTFLLSARLPSSPLHSISAEFSSLERSLDRRLPYHTGPSVS